MNPRWGIVENVERMKRGERHAELISTIEEFGYKVSDLIINAADFGSAQARRRRFLICDREGTTVSLEQLKKFRKRSEATATDIIEWSGKYRSEPLYRTGRAAATIERAERAIAALGPNVPFLIVYYGSDYAGGWQKLDVPLRTVATVDRFGLVTWKDGAPHLRMPQPEEPVRAMGGGREHKLPFGNRREKSSFAAKGVYSDLMTAIFKCTGRQQADSTRQKTR